MREEEEEEACFRVRPRRKSKRHRESKKMQEVKQSGAEDIGIAVIPVGSHSNLTHRRGDEKEVRTY